MCVRGDPTFYTHYALFGYEHAGGVLFINIWMNHFQQSERKRVFQKSGNNPSIILYMIHIFLFIKIYIMYEVFTVDYSIKTNDLLKLYNIRLSAFYVIIF